MHFFLVLIFILGGIGNPFFQGEKLLNKDSHSLEFKSESGKGSGSNNFYFFEEEVENSEDSSDDFHSDGSGLVNKVALSCHWAPANNLVFYIFSKGLIFGPKVSLFIRFCNIRI